VDIIPTQLLQELLKCLLPLNKLAEKLGLGGHHFSHVGGWWRLLRLSATTSTKTTRVVAGLLNHLQSANFSLLWESIIPPRLSVISVEDLEFKDSKINCGQIAAGCKKNHNSESVHLNPYKCWR
jgi:hypothetical protein